tara:strand:- start:36 stop:1949 length:1914 start_codon:yes stop_codon:yes gene_type:complete
MAEKIEVGVVVKGAGKASTQLNTLDKGIKKAGTGMGGLIKATDAFTGGAASGMISAYGGTLKFIKGLKLTKVALISTGIGAIVVLVGSLVAAFMASEGQAKKLKVMMAGLGAIMDKVSQFAVALGAGLVAAFSGKDVTKAYRQELDKMPGSMQDAVDKAMELELATIRLTAAQKAFSVGAANNSLMAKKYNAMAEDNNRSIDKRIELTKTANEFELESLAIRKDLLEQELAIAEGLREQGDRSSDTFDRITAAQVALTNLEGEAFDTKRTQSAKINKLRDEESKKAEEAAEKQKAAADKVAEAEKKKADAIRAAEEARVKSMMESVDQGVLFVLEAQAKELEALELSYFKLQEAQLDYLDEIEANEFAFAEGELKRQEDHLELMEKTFNEKKKAINEKFALAEQAEKIKLEDELFALTLTAKEREELAVQQQYDNRIAIAGDDEGLIKLATERQIADLQAIEAKAAAERVAKELATAQAVKAARMSVVQAGFEALGVMAKTEEQQKKLAIAQILVNQGIAMSNAVVVGLKAAKEIPGGLFAAPGFVASALAIALTSFASIKGVMNQAGAASSGVGDSGGGGSVGIASNREGPTLGLTPDISDAVTPGSIPPINAYVVQTQLADQNALAAQIRSATTL